EADRRPRRARVSDPRRRRHRSAQADAHPHRRRGTLHRDGRAPGPGADRGAARAAPRGGSDARERRPPAAARHARAGRSRGVRMKTLVAAFALAVLALPATTAAQTPDTLTLDLAHAALLGAEH